MGTIDIIDGGSEDSLEWIHLDAGVDVAAIKRAFATLALGEAFSETVFSESGHNHFSFFGWSVVSSGSESW